MLKSEMGQQDYLICTICQYIVPRLLTITHVIVSDLITRSLL